MIDPALPKRGGGGRGIVAVLRSAAALLVVALGFSDDAAARPQEGTASPIAERAPAGSGAGGHGWALLEREVVLRPGAVGAAPGKSVGASLIHLPPRIGPGAADFGTARTVTTFPTAPVRAVGYGPNVYLIFDTDGSPSGALDGAAGGRQRRVLGITAAPIGVGTEISGWRFEPPGRAESLKSLPGEGALVGASASSVGPVALIREGDHAAGESTWRIHVLWRNTWRSFEAPWASAAPGEPGAGGPGLKGLIAGGDGALAVGWMPSPRELLLWEGRFSRRAIDPAQEQVAAAGHRLETERLHIDFTPRRVSLRPPETLAGAVEAADLAWIDGTLILLARLLPVEGRVPEGAETGGLLVFDVMRDTGVLVAHIPGSEERGGATKWLERIIPMHGAGRFALLSEPEDPPAASKQRGAGAVQAGQILEMSTTGRIWYEGEQERQGPLSLRDLRALAFMLGSLAVLVIIFVFRPEATPVVTLPKGAALGAMWRRTLALAVDFVIATVLASLVMGDGPLGLLSALLGGRAGAAGGGADHLFTGLMLAQAMGIAHCSAAEAINGRSIGKAVFGLVILSSRGTPGRVDLRAALLRNIIKWGLPLLLVFALWDPMRRHPGDLLAGTLVVERVEDESPET